MGKKIVGIRSDSSAQDDYAMEREMFEGDDIEIVGVNINDDEEFAGKRRSFNAFIHTHTVVSGEVLDDMPDCGIICQQGQGVDTIDIEAATARGVKVTNVQGFNVEEVSDHALAFAMMLGRNIPFYADAVIEKGIYSFKACPPNVKLAEMNLALLGFGRVSRRLAKKAKAIFGSVSAYDPVMDASVAEASGVSVVNDLDVLLREADILSIHVPLLKETRHLIDAGKLSLMKPTAYLVNCARGAIVDNQALSDALDRGVILGAAVDVVEPEPPGIEGNPLIRNKRCIVTPHIAWYSKSAIKRMRSDAAESARAFLRGQTPPQLLN
ncbi:MAG: C-terminal binding protein [Synergistaceae bacterium]|jgi:phosphoglycerate dehydrogenase-like enzyme|nr:C-terminal binding protein [Synergistaceae bacterium]